MSGPGGAPHPSGLARNQGSAIVVRHPASGAPQLLFDPASGLLQLAGTLSTKTGPVRLLGAGFVGREGVTFLYFYAPPTEYNYYAPAFSSIAQSFRHDPGFEYAPASPYRHLRQFGTVAAATGVILAGVVVAVVVTNRRLKAA